VPTPADAPVGPASSLFEQELLQPLLAQVRRFAAREIDSERIDAEARIPRSVIASAAELGLFGIAIPSEYGGAGLSMRSVCAVVEELAVHDRSVAIMVGLHAGLGTRALIEHGSEPLRARLLPEMAAGERVGAFAVTEPGAGSDLMAVQCSARVEGASIVLDGDKSYVTNGGFAGVFTVLACSPELGGARAHSLVCVERETPGVQIGAEEHKLGIRGSSTVSVHFDRATVARSNVLGAGGQGMREAHRSLAWGRTVMAAGCVGTARAALLRANEHCERRRQFNRPIDAFGAAQAQLARMASTHYAMESVVRAVGAREGDGASIDVESMYAKVFCSEGAYALCDLAVQLHGALGFIEPVGVARLLRDCRITRIFEGANDVLLVRAGVALIAGHKRPTIHVEESCAVRALSDAAAQSERLGATIDAAVAATRRSHGVRAVSHQLLLQRLARAAIAHAATVATIERATRERDLWGCALAAHAVDELCREGARQLEDAKVADEDEARAGALRAALGRQDERSL
jgi:alkylation response protein AidB-like acyl-CoA dehydrogenase